MPNKEPYIVPRWQWTFNECHDNIIFYLSLASINFHFLKTINNSLQAIVLIGFKKKLGSLLRALSTYEIIFPWVYSLASKMERKIIPENSEITQQELIFSHSIIFYNINMIIVCCFIPFKTYYINTMTGEGFNLHLWPLTLIIIRSVTDLVNHFVC